MKAPLLLISFVLFLSVNAQKVESKKGIQVYPVPSNNLVHIISLNMVEFNAKVFTLAGKLVDEFTLLDSYDLNISNYEQGTCVIRFYEGDEIFNIVRIVKI